MAKSTKKIKSLQGVNPIWFGPWPSPPGIQSIKELFFDCRNSENGDQVSVDLSHLSQVGAGMLSGETFWIVINKIIKILLK